MKDKITYWVIADTHFGHDNLCKEDYDNRAPDFSRKILHGLRMHLKPLDVLIHLGDICIGHDTRWHNDLVIATHGVRRILLRGNHDKKTDAWYMDNGWHFVCDQFVLNKYGKRMAFSHEPVESHLLPAGSVNIHGHCHSKGQAWEDDEHVLVRMDHDYSPRTLRSLIGA